MIRHVLFITLFLLMLGGRAAFGQDLAITDTNGDGVVSSIAFGDSITYGVGDASGLSGYPTRVSTLLGIPVTNVGDPGEILTVDGVNRFPSVLATSSADAVLILEGVNDAVHRIDSAEVRRTYQRLVNVAQVLGKSPILMTLPKPCCDHGALSPFTESYSAEVKDIAALNGLSYVDLERAWNSTCQNKNECELYNLPEGLHPNATGYDVLGQTIAASMLGINIFGIDGAKDLEDALGLAEGSVIVKPDEVE